ncbi:MAG: hypothetical protein M3Q29_16165 [Chloroflexota bacterium]|nr:hypothetical protein [Chloroflexota bacterium]
MIGGAFSPGPGFPTWKAYLSANPASEDELPAAPFDARFADEPPWLLSAKIAPNAMIAKPTNARAFVTALSPPSLSLCLDPERPDRDSPGDAVLSAAFALDFLCVSVLKYFLLRFSFFLPGFLMLRSPTDLPESSPPQEPNDKQESPSCQPGRYPGERIRDHLAVVL